jgi:hypothetical protein
LVATLKDAAVRERGDDGISGDPPDVGDPDSQVTEWLGELDDEDDEDDEDAESCDE